MTTILDIALIASVGTLAILLLILIIALVLIIIDEFRKKGEKR